MAPKASSDPEQQRTINGAQLLFDPEDGSLSRLNRRKRHPWKVLVLRDNLVISYKALVAKIRQKASKEIDRLPDAMLRKFASAWHAWELLDLRCAAVMYAGIQRVWRVGPEIREVGLASEPGSSCSRGVKAFCQSYLGIGATYNFGRERDSSWLEYCILLKHSQYRAQRQLQPFFESFLCSKQGAASALASRAAPEGALCSAACCLLILAHAGMTTGLLA